MEELFRFLMVRPAEKTDLDRTTVPVTPEPGYLGRLRDANALGGAALVAETAREHSGSAQALKGLHDLKYGAGLMALASELAGRPNATIEALGKAVKKHLGAVPATVVAAPAFASDRARLGNSVVTAAILSRDEPVSADDAARLLRSIAIVERVAAGDMALTCDSGLSDAYALALALPADPFPLKKRESAPAPPPPPPPGSPSLSAMVDRRDGLLAAYNVLTRISPEHLEVADEPPAREAMGEVSPQIAMAAPVDAVTPDERSAMAAAAQRPEVLTVGLPAGPGRKEASLVLRRDVVDRLSGREQKVFAERGLDLTRMSASVAADRLSVELAGVEQQLAELEAPPAMAMVRLGSTYVSVPAILPPLLPGAFPAAVPSTHGTAAPAGIGDLLVVRQFLKRYEARELAHVENILKGEYKERMHRRSRTTEETFTVETEVKKEEERDLQTTERFELKTEASETLKQDQSLKIGLSVSGSYGPMVEFKATTDFAMNQAKEESSKVATSFSKDVTDRASSKVSERRREERILKTIEVFAEKNTHGVDNKLGADHVVGQYQWIDKLYEAQVFNYGKRLLFDIMLPEPAAFLLYAVGGQPKAGAELVKPPPFTLTPAEISEWNYAVYVKRYEVVGVNPPPHPYITVSRALDGEADKDQGTTTKAMEAPILDGYQAVAGNVVLTLTFWEDSVAIDVVVGKNGHRFTKSNGWSWSFSMANEVGSVPITLKTFRADVFAVAIEIHCQRTVRRLDEWKLNTHAAIMQGYLKLVRDYEDKLAAAEVQAATQIQGRNPLENERLIRTEMKKGAISVFTDQHFDLFGAIATSPQGYPQPDLPEAEVEGRYVRFFEQAFEWEQMMFFFYPYYWGRKANWRSRALLQDVDPMFAEFIKAGSARVVVSVRPGFEQAVAHFLDTGQTWNGGPLPPIVSPLYVSIIDEIRERDKAPGKEVAQGDPWDVRLPTTLVKIRKAGTLPEWQKNPQGEWLPV